MKIRLRALRYASPPLGCALLTLLALPALAANNPPHAMTGPPQRIGVHPGVAAMPTLDASQSFDPDGDPITYEWRDNYGALIGTSSIVQTTIPNPGDYFFTLTVCDTHYDSQNRVLHSCAYAGASVEVVVDVTPPVVDAPDITVSVTEPGSATVSQSSKLSSYMLSGATTSAVDDVDASPQFYRVVANGTPVTSSTVFPEGDTPIVVEYKDQAGNIGASSATVHVVDRQDNDLFIQSGEGNCYGTPCDNVIQRIRGGAVEDFCQLAGGSSPQDGIILDSSGRVVALRFAVNIAGSAGVELVRCAVKGAPPEKFAWFQDVGGVPTGYPEPFPGLHIADGSGLTLARLREVVIDDNQNHGDPFVVNEDAYMLNLVLPGSTQNTNQPVTYHVKQDFWERMPELGPSLSSVSINSPGAALFFHSGATYATRGGCLDRIKNPLSIHATGTVGGVGFDLNLNLFGSSGEICGWVLDNLSGPHPTYLPCTSPAPTDGSALAAMDGLGGVLFDDYSGYGLTLLSDSGATASDGVLTAFSELPFDDPGNMANYFQNPFNGCALTPEVRYDPEIPPPVGGGFWGTYNVASTQTGLVGTSSYAGAVFTVAPGGPSLIAQGIEAAGPITAWPPSISAGAALSVLIRIDSPVDVLVTDPNGKKLGVQNGAAVNDFGGNGADTGAGTHPRFYAINNPVAGDYTVQSVGTGSGPYAVHVYSVDTSKPFGHHIFNTGTASPGALSSQNFTMGAGGGIAFTNHPPTANAGPDQTVTVAAGGTATVTLDGSASSDPDGDALTFTWAGPFGLVTGAQPQVTVPVGVNVLQLTADDGKGGTASANVTITVNPAAPADTTPPVVTPPASISIAASEAGGARGSASAALAAFLAGGFALDDMDPSPVRLSPQAGGMNVSNSTLFPLGTTVVTFRFLDASGNVGSGTASVTVILGSARIAAAVVGKGRDGSGNYYLDLQVSNTGTGSARAVKITQVALRALAGSGTVTYNSALSGALPLPLGSLDAGASVPVRIYLGLPASVTRFSITETGTLQDVTGASYSYSLAQSVIP